MEIEQRLGRRIVFAGKALRSRFDAALGDAGASLPTWIVLAHTAILTRPSQTELAERVGIEAPTLVRHLDRLCGEGLTERLPDPKDRRVTRVALTDKGRVLLDQLGEVADALDAELRSLFTSEEYRVLDQALSRITAYAEEPHVSPAR